MVSVEKRVRDAGLRPTRQRVALADLLFAKGDRHLSAEELHEEALAAGVPCAASRIPGTESLLQDGVTGDTFPAGDAASLAAIITRHLGRQADARRTAEAGRALVEERYSARGLARAYERLYADLAAGRP